MSHCGAGRIRRFRHATLPPIAPSRARAALLASIISFDEAAVSFLISDLDPKPLPRKMFEDIDDNLSPILAAVATMPTHVVRVRRGSVRRPALSVGTP